jgi:hypothetical protein
MKINNLFLLLLSGIFIIAAALTITVVNQQMRDEALEEAAVKSRLILDRNLATHTYFSQDMKPRLFAWSEPFRAPDYFEPTWMSSTHAVRAIDQYFQQLSPTEYYYKECAINARSPQNEADGEESVFISRLNEDPSLEFWDGIREFDGKPFFVVMRKSEIMETS